MSDRTPTEIRGEIHQTELRMDDLELEMCSLEDDLTRLTAELMAAEALTTG